jgi:hypothetical protein
MSSSSLLRKSHIASMRPYKVFLHQRASYASGDFDAKYIPGIVFLIPAIAKIQFTVLRSCGIPNSPFVNFVLAYS